jgi:dsRNA-specific ribonuclease
MDKIEELLKDPKTDLQKQALTDKSYKKTPNNQDCKINFELATYGDAILKCLLCKIYFEKEDEDNFGFKGKLTEWKKQYESDEVLVKFIARHYDILNFLNFDRDDTKKPHGYDYQGRNAKRRYKYIATAMEACIAAVYIENGENEVVEIVKKWIRWIDKETNSSDT